MDFVWASPNPGDITGITATAPLTGGGTSGDVTVGIQDGTTTQKGAVQLEDSTASTSTTKAATPNSVKSAYDLANGAIPKSLVDAVGDLLVGTADNTVGRLAKGTAGQILKVGASTLEWGSASPTFIGCAAYNSNFTLGGTGDQLISFPNEEFDSNGFHDNSTNNSRLTIPSGYAGKYLITAHIDMNGISGYYINSIRQYNSSGSQLTINATGRSFSGTGGGNNFGGGPLTYIVSAAVGDYFQLFYNWQGSTTFVGQNARFQIQYLGA